MVLSTAQQLNSTYLAWTRFTYPDEDKGPIDAIAVPKSVGDTLNSAYALILDMALINFWSIFFGIVLYVYMLQRKGRQLNPLAPKLWNKRSDLIDLVIGAFTSLSQTCPSPMAALLLLLCLASWVGQKATGILVPPLILIKDANAAPVNPNAIYVPNTANLGASGRAGLFALEAPRYLRALGSTAAGEELRKKVDISQGTSLGQTSDGDNILRIDYGYSATGADMGLQKYPDLTLRVSGSCVTEYTWYNTTQVYLDNSSAITTADFYYIWGNMSTDPVSVSLYDGRQPRATFFTGTNTSQGTLPDSNATWAALVSSADRYSFSSSDDPWYRTGRAPVDDATAQYIVLSKRPALSCWQDDVWSYKDQNSTVDTLDTLPGLELSDGLRAIFYSVLNTPMIQQVGEHLGASALLSTTTAIDQIFDAGASSIHGDLERLVQAAYVATINCLTDLTLYPPTTVVPNLARDGSNQPYDGVADFVVWSPDVAALSTVAIITIPSVFAGLWLLSIILLHWTPIKDVSKLDSEGTSAQIRDKKPKKEKTKKTKQSNTDQTANSTQETQTSSVQEAHTTSTDEKHAYNSGPTTELGRIEEHKDQKDE
ncbi:hypothetical protein GGR52DRAFT_181526 [Hypoxylon sp. FL1284]|nr:hypothetical protein GGR52DRAFT_181526 [Hypoxylon sp. FL1284]